MAGVLPRVQSGACCQYPVSRSISFDTAVLVAQNGSEQRWRRRGALTGFTLQYKALRLADRQKLDSFIAAQKGAFDSTWQFYFTPSSLIPNAHFVQGFTSWSVDSSVFTGHVLSYYQYTDPSEAATAYLECASQTVGANSTVNSYLASAKIPVTYGQQYSLSFNAGSGHNYLAPGLSYQLAVVVNQYGANYDYQNTQVFLLNGATAWQNYSTTFSITVPDAVFCSIGFYPSITNGSSTNQNQPANSIAFGIGSVDVSLVGPNATGSYLNCAFESDQFIWTQDKDFPTRWSGQIKFRQTASSSSNYGALVGLQNGSLATDGSGWTLFNINSVFSLQWRPYTANTLNSLVASSLATTIPANTTYGDDIVSAQFPAQMGQQFTFSFWDTLAVNSLPLGIVAGIANFQVSLFDSSGNYLGPQYTGFSRWSNVAGSLQWRQDTTTFTITNPNVSSVQIVFLLQLQNTTGAPIAVPASALQVSVAQVSGQVVGYSSFPQVRPGIVTGLPYTPGHRHFTDRNDLPAGPRVSFAWYAAGLNNLPTSPLMNWGLQFTNASDAELALIESHYRGAFGKYGTFTYTDPDTNIVYPNVRYDMDSLDITHKAPNANDFKVSLTQFWPS